MTDLTQQDKDALYEAHLELRSRVRPARELALEAGPYEQGMLELVVAWRKEADETAFSERARLLRECADDLVELLEGGDHY